jgi:hypothetical protein
LSKKLILENLPFFLSTLAHKVLVIKHAHRMVRDQQLLFLRKIRSSNLVKQAQRFTQKHILDMSQNQSIAWFPNTLGFGVRSKSPPDLLVADEAAAPMMKENKLTPISEKMIHQSFVPPETGSKSPKLDKRKTDF